MEVAPDGSNTWMGKTVEYFVMDGGTVVVSVVELTYVVAIGRFATLM